MEQQLLDAAEEWHTLKQDSDSAKEELRVWKEQGGVINLE